jgi:hypothetical protein
MCIADRLVNEVTSHSRYTPAAAFKREPVGSTSGLSP